MTPHHNSKKPVQLQPPGSLGVAHDPAGPAASRDAAPASSAEQTSKADVSRTRERLIMLMMGLIALAFITGLSIQFEYALLPSLLAGAGLWTMLFVLHAISRKSEQLDRMATEVSRLEGEVSRLKGSGAGHRAKATDSVSSVAPLEDAKPEIGPAAGRLGSQQPASPRAALATASASAPAPVASTTRSSPQSVTASAHESAFSTTPSLMIEPQARWEAPKPAAKVSLTVPHKPVVEPSPPATKSWSNSLLPEQASPEVASAPSATSAPANLQDVSWPGTSVSDSDPMRDAWAFRPKDAPAAPAFAQPEPLRTLVGGQPQSIDRELEIVQRKIKALAMEVNAAEAIKAQTVGDNGPALPSALDFSIGALKATSVQMRDRASALQPPLSQPPAPEPKPALFASADFLIPATAERIAVSEPEPNDRERDVYEAPDFDLHRPTPPQAAAAPAAPMPDPRAATVTNAIQAGDMDVFLSPIVALADHAVSHYEVVVRLRAPSGDAYEKPEHILELAGSELIGLFDSARLTRSAAVAERLEARGKNGSVLSSITGQSMTDGGFLETFARVYEERQSISGQLVLTLSQADVARLSPSAWQAIGDMHAFGFRFAIEDISHLDTDFENLARHGFAFAKLPAKAFLNGLPSHHGVVPAHEICHTLAKAGLALVADAIDSDEVRARVFGFGILFGQGQLFGGARAMSLAPVPEKRTAAA